MESGSRWRERGDYTNHYKSWHSENRMYICWPTHSEIILERSLALRKWITLRAPFLRYLERRKYILTEPLAHDYSLSLSLSLSVLHFPDESSSRLSPLYYLLTLLVLFPDTIRYCNTLTYRTDFKLIPHFLRNFSKS